MQRSLEFVHKRCAAQEHIWREFVASLSAALVRALEDGVTLAAWEPANDPARDAVAALGIRLARSYRESDVTLSLLLGVMNAYREGCLDCIAAAGNFPPLVREESRTQLNHFLDRLEAGICAGWLSDSANGQGSAQSDELFRAVLDAVPDILLVKDRNSVFLGVSERYTALMGRSEAAILGSTDFDLFPQADALRYMAEEVSVMESGEPIVAEHLLNTSCGERWFEAIKCPLRNRSGEIIGVLSTERDITERKRLEMEVSEQRRFLQTILATLADAIFFKDLDSRIVLCNHAVSQFFDKTEAEIVGKTDFELVPEELAQRFRDEDLEVIATGRPVRSQHSIESPAGTRWDETIRTPLRNESGEIVGVLVTARDITAQVKAQSALQESETYVKTILESMPVGMMVIDAETHTIIDVNSAALALLGRMREEVVGMRCHNHVCPAAPDSCPITGLSRDIGPTQRILLRADGTTLPVLKTVAHITLQGRQVLLESFIDIEEQLKAQASLRESEERYRGLVEMAPISIVVHSAGRLVFANPEAVRTFGVESVEQLLGRPVLDFIHPDQREWVAERIEHIYRREMLPGLVEEKYLQADGTPLDVEVTASPITFEGKPASQVVFRDITARKRTEEALVAERTLFQALMDNLPDSIYFKDTHLRFVRVNRSQAALLGCAEPQAAVGKTDFDFYTAEHAAKSRADEQRILDSGEPLVGNLERVMRADGRATWMSTTAVPLYGAEGELLGLVGLSRDVDEQVRAEADRDNQRRMLRAVLDTLPDMIIFKDRHSAFQLCNQRVCDFFGKSMNELIGKTDFELFSFEDAYRFRSEELEAMETGHTVVNERLTAGPQGILWEEAIKVPLRSDSGEVIGVLSVGRDITERRAAEAERDEQRKMLRSVLDASSDVIFFKDKDFVYRLCNQAFANFHRVQIEDIIGKTAEELWNSAEVCKEFRAEDVRVLAGEQLVVENLLQMPWGTSWHESIKTPLRNDDGETIGLISFERDVTKRKEMEESLHASQQSLSALLSNLPGMAYRCRNDEQWTMEFVSEGCLELTGYEPAELLDNRVVSYTQLIHPADREMVWNEVRQALARGEPFRLTYRIITAQGDVRWVWEQGREVPSPHAGHVHLEGFVSDITERVRAEEELSRQTAMLQVLLDTTSDIIVFKDRRAVILAASRVIADILGESQEALRGKTDFDLFAVDVAQVFWDEEQRVMDTREAVTTDHQLVLADGQIRWFEVVKKPVLDNAGDVVGLLSSEHDITERKRMEQALQTERNLLRTMVDNIPDFIFVKDIDCRMVFNNIAHAVALGVNHPDEVLGKTDFAFFPLDVAQAYHEGDVEVLESGQSVRREELYTDASGETRWLLTTRVPLRDVAGNITGLVGVSHDITDDRRTQESLRQARDELEIRVEERTADLAIANIRLQVEVNERKEAQSELQWHYHQAERARSESSAILDATGEAMILISPERWILSANRRFTEFFALAQSEVIGNRVDDLQRAVERIFEDPAALMALIVASISDVERKFVQAVVQSWPVQRELELYSTPVRTGEGEHLGRLFVFRDVTRERQVDRMKTEFVSLVSHELRTPLTSIKGYVDLLIGGKAGALDATQRRFLTVVKNNAERLVSLINDLLDISRIESGTIELKRGTLDLRRLLVDVTNSIQPQLEEKSQRLALDIEPELPNVWADADRVTVILTNLLSNAYKYTPEGGAITVSACRTEAMVRVDVRDTGVGMTPEEQSKLFTKFFRSDNWLVQENVGTGLGLVITRALVEMQGGEIHVASSPGEGSVFGFTLPLSAQGLENEPVDGPGESA